MPSAKNTKRSHPGLCLDLLDEEHKKLFTEMAFLLDRLSNLGKGEADYRFRPTQAVCPVCDARASMSDAEIPSDVVIEHKQHCAAQHAKRLLAEDSSLDSLALTEFVSPQTPAGQAAKEYRRALAAKHDPKSAKQEETLTVSE